MEVNFFFFLRPQKLFKELQQQEGWHSVVIQPGQQYQVAVVVVAITTPFMLPEKKNITFTLVVSSSLKWNLKTLCSKPCHSIKAMKTKETKKKQHFTFLLLLLLLPFFIFISNGSLSFWQSSSASPSCNIYQLYHTMNRRRTRKAAAACQATNNSNRKNEIEIEIVAQEI